MTSTLSRRLGSTTYVVCPPGTDDRYPAPVARSCCRTSTLYSLEDQEGAIAPNVGQLNALISPGLNHYNALYAQLQRRASKGFAALVSYTFSKNMQSNGADFNNQFDFSDTRGPSLLDQRHRLSVAAIYQSGQHGEFGPALRRLLSDWTLSTVTRLGSGGLTPRC